MRRLTARRVAALKRPGRYSDGHGLMLFVQRSGARSWVQRITLPDGRRVDRGLGSVDIVSLAQAREWALANKLAVRKGIDPFAAQPSKVPTFAVACRRAAEASPLSAANETNRRAALERYCGALMGRRLDAIRRADVIAILSPVTAERPALGAKLKGWIRGAFAWGVAREHIEYNPADGIAAALPKRNGNGGDHHAALPYQDVGAALARLDASGAAPVAKAAIRLLALTATRSGEVRGATWDEVDLEAREWRIPASRMKTGAEHRVPLSPAAVRLLRRLERDSDDGLIFPSSRGKVIAAATLLKAWRPVEPTATLHGFRSSFRTWAAERTDATRDVAEMCLAHIVGSDIERSYARSDLFDRRRRLMDQWAEYVVPIDPGDRP